MDAGSSTIPLNRSGFAEHFCAVGNGVFRTLPHRYHRRGRPDTRAHEAGVSREIFLPLAIFLSVNRLPGTAVREASFIHSLEDISQQRQYSRKIQMNKILGALMAGLFAAGAYAQTPAAPAAAPVAPAAAAAPAMKEAAAPAAKAAPKTHHKKSHHKKHHKAKKAARLNNQPRLCAKMPAPARAFFLVSRV